MIRYKNLTILVHNVQVNLNGSRVSLRILREYQKVPKNETGVSRNKMEEEHDIRREDD